MAIKAVVFDIGNVLIEWHPERFYDAQIGPNRRRALFAEVDLHGMNLNVDRGHDWRNSVYELAEKHPEWQDEIRLWHDSWLQMAAPEIPHSTRLLRALKANGTPVFALSNFGIGTFELACKAYPVLTEFDRSFVSGYMQVIKPDAEIYARVEADCGHQPANLLFADDRPENIKAAAVRGWQTHLFTSPLDWAERLVSEALLTKEQAT
ncbi:HAD family hydrolase [Parasedimentitalea psychrophila]|uniref:HAD family phosphatase n=1 Tax=Parasedimentitalea psychrophila TaxID=2997337 RepID=A0A9Y2P441_9RHOB|nr:HAD family phosphatase [Parasedimentitalea psychrophila]WIY26627.1 HAD family phosphatase [Parasedimentitalea psychrophila]